MQQPIYVIGHKNPDTDSICGAIALAKLKQAQGHQRDSGTDRPFESGNRIYIEQSRRNAANPHFDGEIHLVGN